MQDGVVSASRNRPCAHLSNLDVMDGLTDACNVSWQPASAADRTPVSVPWWQTHPDATGITVGILVSVICAAVFFGLLAAGQAVMCNVHDDALRYCPGYNATAVTE
jgi:hypothetical protein